MSKEPGFFVMKDAAEVLKQPELTAAKSYLKERITEFVKVHPVTKPENVVKANKMVDGASSLRTLSMAVANFVLAHTSENLKVIR